ncbi:PEP/pyruvate-binding domain-containing protein [Zoogloea sp. LCSB751]|uniref:PEP/pyruvate-binding domain-containing protein n=1 Tax=Zoogloea sp. LCSB751 TaxID=1965277 RepID=UPI0009A4F2C0|nr:PEP/pyruvate-binding domain-containing protein [Zoogloea sp. LCSB751]
MNTLLLPDWSAVLAAGAPTAGGKAWTLARLARYDFAIPAGMVVPVTAYRAWLTASGLETALLEAAAGPEAGRTTALGKLGQQLRATPVDERLADILRVELTCPPWRDAPLAVRSSSPQEDSASASFAGIHASCLNVRGSTALLEALVQVWASLWTPAAVAYRQRFGIAQAEAAMAVLIMPLVPAMASGIGFTCDPRDGRDDRLVIHASWGLGESLVGGHTTGDEIVLAEDPLDDHLTLLEYTPGDKRVATVPAGGHGTARVATTPDKAGAPVLDTPRALALGEQLRLAAQALDYARAAYDCEWAWDGQRFWLLQARPITAMGRCTYPELANQPDIWSRGNTRDVVPAPLSPVDWGASRRLVNNLLEGGYRLAGFTLHPGAQRAGLFHGRLYLNLSLMQWEGYAAFAVAPAAMNRLVGGHQPEIHVPALDRQQRLRRMLGMLRFMRKAGSLRQAGETAATALLADSHRWRHQPLPADDTGLAAELRRLTRHGREQHALHFMQGSGGASLSLLVDLIDAHLPGEGHALASALLAGGPPSVTARQSYELHALARQAMADPVARAWLDAHRREGGDWRTLPTDNAFRQAFADFLERYGHRGVYETYLRNPRWRECPDYLLDSLPGLAATDLAQLQARQARCVADATARVRAALPWWKRGFFRSLLRSAKQETNGREAARSALIACTEPARRVLLAVGQRWHERGWAGAADDVFLLMPAEILAVLDGQRPGTSLGPLIEERKGQLAAWETDDVPDVILDGTAACNIAATAPAAVNGDNIFHGVPVGSGRAAGPVRILHSPEEGRRLEHGAILVVPSTDPAWTPLFLKAGGLVMETGGFLSHGAIVAREFGIPAVVNLPGILQILRDGEHIEVDGVAGTVRRAAALPS